MILSDVDSWLNVFVEDLLLDWCEPGHKVRWRHQAKHLTPGDFCFCLGFGQLVRNETRALFRHTLVVHESDLPQGKGWSPLTWQILEGHNRIPVTLFEAAEAVDSGAVYAQKWLQFHGHELIDELRAAQAGVTLDLCRWFVDHYPDSAQNARAQAGEETFYPRRTARDSRLDPARSIAEQFNALRVVDNQRYPAYFELQGQTYCLNIRRS